MNKNKCLCGEPATTGIICLPPCNFKYSLCVLCELMEAEGISLCPQCKDDKKVGRLIRTLPKKIGLYDLNIEPDGNEWSALYTTQADGECRTLFLNDEDDFTSAKKLSDALSDMHKLVANRKEGD